MYDIPVGFHFRVEFNLGEGTNDNRFQEVGGLTQELTTEEFREGGVNDHAYKLPNGTKYGNLVLKRAMFLDSEVIKWCRDALENFSFKPTNVLVSLLNESHTPLAAWQFSHAWPVKWSISEFKGQDNSMVIESLELAYQFFRKQ